MGGCAAERLVVCAGEIFSLVNLQEKIRWIGDGPGWANFHLPKIPFLCAGFYFYFNLVREAFFPSAHFALRRKNTTPSLDKY